LKKGIGGPLTIERLVDAITGGTLAVALHDRLALLEDRRLQLEGSAVNRGHPRAAPPPNLADVYRQRVAELTRVLEADNAAEAPELVRSLVETITLVPEGGVLRIEVRGELAAIWRIAEGAERARNAGRDADALAVQIKMVAGTGFEPVTFRL
jgi:site-specific DNA recombinase